MDETSHIPPQESARSPSIPFPNTTRFPMKLEFQMVSEFGEFLADGHVGNQFRALQIESIWDRVESVTFDFTGVTNLTDSFVHACFGNMAEEHGEDFVKKVRFKGCSPLVKSFLSIAVSEGLKKHREMHSGR
jgi:hypothetical protein